MQRTKILHVTVDDCYQMASTWWRATKEASCIIGNAMSGMQRAAQTRSSSPLLWTCMHRYTDSNSSHPLPPGFTVRMVLWICTVCRETDCARTNRRGNLHLFQHPLTMCRSKSKKNVHQDVSFCHLKKAVRSVSQSLSTEELVEIWTQLQNSMPFNFGTQKTERTAFEMHLKSHKKANYSLRTKTEVNQCNIYSFWMGYLPQYSRGTAHPPPSSVLNV